MHIAILGRQPQLGVAELEKVYGSEHISWFSDATALVDTDSLYIETLGGTQKAGRVVLELPRGDFRTVSMKIVHHYEKKWATFDGKITLGLSVYNFSVPVRDIQKTGLILKQKLKKSGNSLRLIPNTEPALNTAVSHHNKLGLSENKIELLIVRAKNGRIIVAESTGAQNITSLARRDQGRPKRDAFVGMLPPKLAQIMVNLASPLSGRESQEKQQSDTYLLDPFCGTGVILQEAALMGYQVYGTDLSEKMVDYSAINLEWLKETYHISPTIKLHAGDAMNTKWEPPVDIVACEAYLGQPFSAPPSPAKLAEVRRNCNHIISSFLKNISSQITPDTPLCIAVPAWKAIDGSFTHLPLVNDLESLGFTRYTFKNTDSTQLLYYREDQVVARELLILTKA